MKQLTLEEKYSFTSELYIILSSGLSINEGLEIMKNEIDDHNMKEVIEFIVDKFDEQGNLAEAIKESNCFDKYMETMVQIGELSGNLDNVVNELSKYYEREKRINIQIKEAVTYPMVLIILMLLIVGVIAFKVLPILENVLGSLNTTLSSGSKALMTFGKSFAIVSFVILLIIVILAFIIYLYTRKSNVSFSDNLFSKFPLTRKLSKEIETARLTFALSLFLSSGYPIEDAVKLLVDYNANNGMKTKLTNILDDLNKDKTFTEALNDQHIYEGYYASIITIALKTGRGDDALKNLVTLYEDNVENATAKFLNIIEPSIIALLSLIVGIILLSIMLPLLSIMASL